MSGTFGIVAIAFWGWTPEYSGRAPLKAPTYDYDAPRMNPKVATSMMQFDDPMQFWSIFASAMEENPSRRMRSTEPMVVCYRGYDQERRHHSGQVWANPILKGKRLI
jgi:hypothetical protein